MKTIRILTTALLAATLLGSCSKDNGKPEVGTTPVAFAPVISGANATPRASGTTWANGDAIGVFMKTAGGALPGDILSEGGTIADNVQYTNSASGFTTTTPIYYPQAGNVDFVAYYPYRTKPATDPYIYKVSVADQTAPAAIDLLYATKTNVAKSKTAVALEFDHKLSQIVLKVTKGTGMETTNLATMSVQITGMPTTADFKLANGTFDTSSDIADITPRVVTAGTTYDAILIPQAANSYVGRKMVFTVGTDVYEYLIPDADDFLSGKSYTYTVTVKKTGIEVSKGSITDWTTTTPGDLGEVSQLPIPMVLIPAGTFLMGSSDGSNIGNSNGSGLNTTAKEPNRQSNETQHKVTLTKDFYMSKYQITNAQYAAFLNDVGVGSDGKWSSGPNSGEQLISASSGSYDWGLHYNTDKWEPVSGFESHPVINVSWYGSVAYCTWLSQATGFTYRLPTEAEWEYACRGDYPDKATETATKPFGIGDGTKLYADMANFDGKCPYALPSGHIDNFEGDANHPNTYLGKTQPVGSYTANSYGLYDMHGNVWEWCSDKCDWLIADYDAGTATDPTGPDTGDDRVLRGGSWDYNAQFCRSAFRYYNIPDNRSYDVGFRVVFVP